MHELSSKPRSSSRKRKLSARAFIKHAQLLGAGACSLTFARSGRDRVALPDGVPDHERIPPCLHRRHVSRCFHSEQTLSRHAQAAVVVLGGNATTLTEIPVTTATTKHRDGGGTVQHAAPRGRAKARNGGRAGPAAPRAGLPGFASHCRLGRGLCSGRCTGR